MTSPQILRFSLLALCLAVGLLSFACSDTTEGIAERSVTPGEAIVEIPDGAGTVDDAILTETNVYDFEEHWPNIVAVEREWHPPGMPKPLEQGYRGALVRVERDGFVRIDFGRHGRHDVPIGQTDLVRAANQVRVGTRHKTAPNFVLQVGTRLVDSTTDEAKPVRSADFARARVFLCVFADPMEEGFPALARHLSGLADIEGLGMLLFPQSGPSEDLQAIKERLRSSEWAVPFSYPRLTENHTLSLLGEQPTGPYALVVTPEGRVLYRSDLGKVDALAEIRISLES